MNFCVLDFFKFAFRMAQIAQMLVSTFKIFQGRLGGGRGGGGGGGGRCLRTSVEISSFYSSVIPGSD